ncbi:MAG: homoserine dehydrogenase [Cellulosilyticaceae bacterium]
MMNIAVLGYGTVGSGVVEVIHTNKDSIDKRAGRPIEIKYILDLRDFPEDPIQNLLVKDFDIILKDESVEIIAEAMGGIEPAYTYVKSALLAGKSVVTSNKELVALHGGELLEIARNNAVNFLFEASVGGGIPIIRPLNQSLTADEIYEITGILNGTTNFILTKMRDQGRGFDDVLKEAQQLGYAERNPEADVEGHDACRKIAILSSLAFGEHVHYQDIPTEGITKITTEDMAYANAMGYVIKLLATCQKQDSEVFARVAPTMLPLKHPLANVDDVFNAILVKGNVIGDVMFYGKGAGKLPTASAVVADIVDAAKHKGTNIISFWSQEKIDLKSKAAVRVRYFVRLFVGSLYGEGLAKENFLIDKVIAPIKEEEYVFITQEMTEEEFKNSLESLPRDVVVKSMIRIEK